MIVEGLTLRIAVVIACIVFLIAVSRQVIFLAGLFFLLAICLSLSIIVSKQALRIKTLVQEHALIAKRLDALENGNDR